MSLYWRCAWNSHRPLAGQLMELVIHHDVECQEAICAGHLAGSAVVPLAAGTALEPMVGLPGVQAELQHTDHPRSVGTAAVEVVQAGGGRLAVELGRKLE